MKTLLYALSAVIIATSAAAAGPLDSPHSDRASAKPSERGDAQAATPFGLTYPERSPVSDRAGVKAPEQGDALSNGDRRAPVSLQRDVEFGSGPQSSGDATFGWTGNDNEG